MPKDNFTVDMDEPENPHAYNAATAYNLPAIKSKAQALAAISSKGIRVGAFVWTSVGLQVDGQIKREDWEETGRLLRRLDISLQWLIGDWVVAAAELTYGDRQEFAESIGFSTKSLYEFSYVASKVDFSIRMENLDFGHHQVVAGMTQDRQVYWLKRASEGDDGKRWSVARLRQEIAGNKLTDKPSGFVRALGIVDSLTQQSKNLNPDEKRELATLLRKRADEIDNS